MKKYKFPFNGKFGIFGGKYIPETLVPAIEELEESYKKFTNDPDFQKELKDYLENYAGRPTPIYLAKNLTKYAGGAKIYLKREDLSHKLSSYELHIHNCVCSIGFGSMGVARQNNLAKEPGAEKRAII